MVLLPQGSQAPDPLIGTLVGGRYRVTGVLGTGGMGRVYAAVQEGLGRPVALKVLLAGKAWDGDPLHQERFVREAEGASALNHPNIVSVYDFGLLPDGRPYLAMEHLVGLSFAEVVVRDGPLPLSKVADLIRQAASALDALHSIGVVHRDVKSENLVLAELPDGQPIVKLIDFGLVALADRHRLTKKGFVVGTPDFVAPEALELDHVLPDRRADVYSLAVVAFELLSGAMPYEAESMKKLLAAKLRGRHRSLSEAAGFDFHRDLEALIAQGLARRPNERFTSAGAFAAALTTVAREGSGAKATRPIDLVRRREPERDTEPTERPTADNVWSFAGDNLVIEASTLESLSRSAALRRRAKEAWFLLGAVVLAITLVVVAAWLASS